MNKETHWGPGPGMPKPAAGGSGGCGSAETRRPKGSPPSEHQRLARALEGRAQRAAPAKARAAAPAPDGAVPEDPPPWPRQAPQSRARADGAGRRAAGLHMLNEAPALGGFAQEPPVVVGAGGGPILLLLAVPRRPAPASETRGRASAAPPRAAHPRPPRARRVLLPHLPPNCGRLITARSRQQGSDQTDLRHRLSRFSKLLSEEQKGRWNLVEPGCLNNS